MTIVVGYIPSPQGLAAVDAAMQRRRRGGRKLAWVHLRHLNPLPRDLGDILRRYPRVLAPELNKGQLARLLRAEYLVDVQSLSKVQGLPFAAREVEEAIEKELTNG